MFPPSGWVEFLELVTDLSPTPPIIGRKRPPSSSQSCYFFFRQKLETLPSPFHGYPGPNYSAYARLPTVPPGQPFSVPPSVPGQRRLFRLSPATSNSRFVAPDPALYVTPPLTGSIPPTALELPSTTQRRTTFATTLHPLARQCFRLHLLSHVHVVSSSRRSILHWLRFF